MIREEVIYAIDNIRSTQIDSELAVMESMINFFDKSFVIMENSDVLIDEVSIFQEAKKEKGILDKVKDKGKKDSNKFVTILMFIPRLIMAIVDSIKNFFKDEDLGKKIKDAGKRFNNGSDIKEKEARAEKINKMFEGQCECYVDNKDGKLKFKDDEGKGIMSRLCYFSDLTDGAVGLFKKVKSQFDPNDPGKIRSLITDCDKFLKKDPSVKKFDLFEGGIEAVGEVMSTCSGTAKELSLLNDGIQEMTRDIVRRDMMKDMPDEKKQEVMKSINELSGKIKEISARIAAAVGNLHLVKVFGEKICDVKHAADNEKALITECARDYVIKKYIKTDFKKDHPQQYQESDAAYEERLHKIKNAAADTYMKAHPNAKEEAMTYVQNHFGEWKKAQKNAAKNKKS